jgi:L-asparaginase/Glu-tRNA(Gln) amidotransferase subunit D
MYERILLIKTGGTFDSVEYEDPKNPPKYVETLKGENSLILPIINTFRVGEKVDSFVWGEWQEGRFVKDSKLFSDEDIIELAEIIKQDEHNLFVITHGTDAIVKNACLLQEQLEGSGKVVALVGAMVPLSMHDKHISDGVDALKYTLEHIESKSPNVYVVGRDLHSKRLQFFDPTKVQKDRETSLELSAFTLR